MVACCPLSGSDGADAPKMFSGSTVKAAKDYHCTECGETIAKGTKHEVHTGLWDKKWDVYRTCLSCVEIRDHFACDGWIYGQLWEDLQNNFFPDMKMGGPCMEGLSVAAKTRLVEERLQWVLDGNLAEYQ